MPTSFNIYCDESCHLEHDRERSMVFGAIMCPADRTYAIAEQLRRLKAEHGLSRFLEVKWQKVSKGELKFYLDLVDFFFAQDDLRFRALVVPEKGIINPEAHGLTHDEFYYRMYYQMLRPLLSMRGTYRIFVDIKDTRSARTTAKLGQVLANKYRDFAREHIRPIELVRSQQVQQVQLADLLIGAVAYANRGIRTSAAKLAVVDRIRERAGQSLVENSSLFARKLNVFVWKPAGALPRE
jgi:hypothetical protein